MRKVFIYFLIVFCPLYAHGTDAKLSLLTQDQLVDILVDLELTKAIVYQQDKQEIAALDQRIFHQQAIGIYKSHGTDPVTFAHSYAYHLADTDQVYIIYEKLIKRLETLLQENSRAPLLID
jgi:hypothetical protein